jgi:hypothetical protein
MKASVLFLAACGSLGISGCMTSAVIHDARHPAPGDVAPWGNYLLLPITIPGDIATSPVQIPAFPSYVRGHRLRDGPICGDASASR